MLNPFPDLLTYSLLGPFILRIVVGLVFIDLGFLALKNEKERWLISLSTLGFKKPESALKIFGLIEILAGVMLLIGFYTQVAALVLALLTFAEAYIEYKDPLVLKRNLVFYVLVFSIVFSLLFLGAGAFAIDIPL